MVTNEARQAIIATIVSTAGAKRRAETRSGNVTITAVSIISGRCSGALGRDTRKAVEIHLGNVIPSSFGAGAQAAHIEHVGRIGIVPN